MSRITALFDQLGPRAGLIVPVALLALALGLAVVRRIAEPVSRVLAAVGVAMSLVLVLVMTMKPAAGGLGVRVAPVWDPTITLRALTHAGTHQLRLDALGNLLLLMPLGCALMFLVGARLAAVLVLVVSVSAEITQWAMATGRTPDTADVVLNVTGGLVGVAIATAAVAAVSALGRHGSDAPPLPGGTPTAGPAR